MKLVKMISKFEEGNGFAYTTEYDNEEIKEVPNWNDLDNSWVSELIENEPSEVDYQCWYNVIDDNGDIIDCSDKFWAR